MESPAALRNSADGYNHDAWVPHDDLDDAEGNEVERDDEVAYFCHACTTEFYAARDAGPEQLRCTHCDGDFVERLPEGAATFAEEDDDGPPQGPPEPPPDEAFDDELGAAEVRARTRRPPSLAHTPANFTDAPALRCSSTLPSSAATSATRRATRWWARPRRRLRSWPR